MIQKKVKNPYSRKRYPKKEKFDRRLSEIIKFWVNNISVLREQLKSAGFNDNNNSNGKKLSLLKKCLKLIDRKIQNGYFVLIKKIGENIGGKSFTLLKEKLEEDSFENVEKPDEVEIDLITVYITEFIPIENLEFLRKGLKRLILQYPPKNVIYFNDINQIDDFCNHALDIHDRGCYQIGTIEFNNKKNSYVKLAEIFATHFTSSIITLQFVLYPSDIFKNKLKDLMKSKSDKKVVLSSSLKGPIVYWGASHYSPVEIKKQKIEDFLIELKWEFLREINNYVKLFLQSNEMISPSIEVYKVTQSYSSIEFRSTNNEVNLFWESIGMSQKRSFNCDISEDGFWKLHWEKLNDEIDNTIKIEANSLIPLKSSHTSIDSQINHMVKFFAIEVLPLLAIKTYIEFFCKQLAFYRNILYGMKFKPDTYEKMLKYRVEIEKNLQLLWRIKGELKNRDYEYNEKKITCIFTKLTSVDKDNDTWMEWVVRYSTDLLKETSIQAKTVAKIIDDAVQLMTIKQNNKLQKRSIWLTIVTVILTFITVILTLITVCLTYTQLKDSSLYLVKRLLHYLVRIR